MLERILRSELDQARRIYGAGDLPEGCGADSYARGLPERWVVEDVEEVSPKIQGVPLIQPDVLGQGKVPVLLRWAPESVTRSISIACRSQRIGNQGGAGPNVG